MKLNKKLIPKGYYCYEYVGKKIVNCPFWSIDENKPRQQNGHCGYLKKGDWNLNKEKIWRIVNKNTGKVMGKFKSAVEIGLPLSTLWDQTKMCNINQNEEIL